MPTTTQATPYIRGSVIDFSVKGLKPLTRVYPYFDGQNVAEHCKMSSALEYNTSLVTDSFGELSGQFRIPAGVFLVGTKLFTLSNSSVSSSSDADCIAVATFAANSPRIFDYGTINSTQVPNITLGRSRTVQDPNTARQTFGISYKDPIAQTFFVQNNPQGLALTKMDVYFKTRPSSSIPITLQIRETVDGFPSDNILPYSTVTLYPKDVNVSDDASAPTQFTFSSPVYLKNNTEYCFVLLPAGDNTDYQVWVGKLGEQVVGSTTIIDSQPNIGRLIIATNGSDWTSYNDRDIKCTLYQATFNDSVTGTIVMKNKKVDYITVSSDVILNPGDILVQNTGIGEVLYFEESKLRAEVLVTSGYFTSSAQVSIALPLTGTATVSLGGTTLTGTNSLFSTELSATDVLINSSNVTIGTVSSVTNNTSATISAAAVAVTGAQIYQRVGSQISITLQSGNTTHAISPVLSYLNFPSTVADWSYKMYASDETAPSGYTTLPEISTLTEGEKAVFSYSYEKDSMTLSSSVGSLMVQGSLQTNSENISPLIDVEKSHFITLENYVDEITTLSASAVTVSASSTTVTGSGSSFLDATSSDYVVVGAVLRNDDNQVIGVVQSVNSNTSLTLYDGCPTNAAVTSEQIYIDNFASKNNTQRVGQYITKNVELANGQDADDIIVYLTADIPSNTDIRVYAKLLSNTDTNGMDNRVWTLLEKQTANSALGIANYQFVIRENSIDDLTAVGGLSTGVFTYTSLDGNSVYSTFKTFAIKIVMVTSNPAVVPSVSKMGVIALTA